MSDGAGEEPRTDDAAPADGQPRSGGGPSKRTIGLVAAGAGAMVLLISGSVALGMVAGAAMVRSQTPPVVEAASATDVPGTPVAETPSASPTPSPEDSTADAAAPAPAPPGGGDDGGSGDDGAADPGVQQLHVSVQPISVCLDDGSECAPVGDYDARTNEIWSAAGITVDFLPTIELHQTALMIRGCSREFLAYAHALGESYEDPAPIRFYIADCAGSGAGYAWTGFNGVVMRPGLTDPPGKVPAMYLAANLGVPYTDALTTPARLMERSSYGIALTEEEIEIARASRLLEPVD